MFSVSAKDRAAIFTGGLHPDGAFWLDRDTGRFETSEYYADALPAWLEDFNRQDWLGGFFGTSWEPLPAVAEVLAAGTYGIAEVPTAPVADRFPHRLGTVSLGPDEAFYYSVTATPLTDTYVGRMAAAMLAGERLGTDDVPDLLGVSFSLTDIVGHRFGSDSPEILDTLLRLDQTLGELLDAVDAQVGLEHTLVSLSADHGALGNPEHLAAGAHPEAGRYSPEVVRCVQATARSVEETLGHGRWTAQETYLDRAALATAGLDRDRVEADLAQALEACPRIEQVWTEAELRSPAVPGEDPAGELYRHSFHPERSPDLTLQETRFTLAQPTVVSGHGSPCDYDTHVPWIVRLPSGLPGVVDTPAKTVDVAPSLARWLGIEPPPDLDGVDRTAIVEATAKARKPETATVAAP